MLIEVPYNRIAVAEYAERWALSRNPEYMDFESMGGDCTNFASQCIFSGSRVMNYAPTLGWFYISINNRSAAWSGVEFLHNFIINNKSVGPYGEETNRARVEVGDFVQLGDETGHFYHSPVVVGITSEDIFIAAHTYDAYMRPLSSYEYQRIRYIHILGTRKYQ